ncbi:MAG: sensor histidine kinase [Gemmatimonadota bacterium]
MSDVWWSQPRRVLIALHVPFFAFSILQIGNGLGFYEPGKGWMGVPMVLLAAALQLRHSLATADGRRAAYWRWTLLALVVLAQFPVAGLLLRWFTMHWYVIASCAMLLPARRAALVAGGSTAVGIARIVAASSLMDMDTAAITAYVVYAITVMSLGGASLYGAVRLVRLTKEVRAARAGLAEVAIGRERLRISRDLHDLMGHSLSAVSLKGDLALRLLEHREVGRAREEMQSLVAVARTAMHDLLRIPHTAPPISWPAELERATDLLTAAGIEPRVSVASGDLGAALDELFAWGLREGITNVLRHSQATACTISLSRTDGVIRLLIENDGAMLTNEGGHGLSGLATRAAAVSGTVHSEPLVDGGFRLRIEAPAGAGARAT